MYSYFHFRESKLDRDRLKELCDKWRKNGDKVFLEEDVDKPFLLVHITKFQLDLMHRYGKTTCLLDATYKTTKYALPLFFIACHTNAGYRVLAQFVVERETTHCVQEALQIIRSLVSDFKPTAWIVDFSEAEIAAIEGVFPGTL